VEFLEWLNVQFLLNNDIIPRNWLLKKSVDEQRKNSEFRYQVTAHKEETPARRKNECSNGVQQAGVRLATRLNETLNN
jgi:hypothetical protein